MGFQPSRNPFFVVVQGKLTQIAEATVTIKNLADYMNVLLLIEIGTTQLKS